MEIYSSFLQLSNRWWLCRLKYRVRSMTLEDVKHLQRDNISFPLRFVGTCFRPRPFWPGPREAPVSWLKLDSKCCHFFLVQTMFLNIDMNMILSSKKSGFCPFKYFWICFLIPSFESPGNSCQTNCTSRDNKLKCLTNPCSFQSCKYASLRSINIYICRCTSCIKSLVLGKLLFIAIFFWSRRDSL